MSLFAQRAHGQAPLAERVRPKSLEALRGQTQLLGPQGVIQQLLANQRLFSLVFWGPPGTGKTTLSLLLAQSAQAKFVQISAVSSGIKEVKEVMEDARDRLY